jgi:hypothetical protein
VPVFFIATGLRFPLVELLSDPSALLSVLIFPGIALAILKGESDAGASATDSAPASSGPT